MKMTKKYLRIGVLSLFSIFFLSLSSKMAFAYGGYGGGWGMGPGMMGGWGMGSWGFIPMLLFWGLFIAAIVVLIKWLAGSGRAKDLFGNGGSRALEILKERYARGEIDEKEFEEKKRVLEK
jgi:putative membrane protein